MCVQCFSFLSSCLKESFRFCLSQGTNRTQYTPDIWGSPKTKKAGWLAAALRTHGAADRGQQKEKGACIPNSCFPRSCKETNFRLGQPAALMGPGILQKPGRAGSLAAAPENLQYHKQTQEGARDYEHLKKEDGKSLWLGIYRHKSREDIFFKCTSLEKTFPYKRFERPPDSVAGLMGKDLFLYKKKTGRWLFFQMHGSKHKVPRCMRNSKTRSNQIHKINFQQSTLETDVYEIT